MMKIGICGHYGGENSLNGQTVKTKIITNELINHYGKNEILCFDSSGGFKKIFKHICGVLNLLRTCDNVIILPAHNGLRVFAPILAFANKFYKKKLHYIVIGGWLPEFLKKRKHLSKSLKKFDYIYTETSTMKKVLERQGFNNIVILPNCKKLNILKQNELIYCTNEPYKLCTFSRVMKEKGIDDAVEAVKYINDKYGRTCYALDIYGQVDSNQTEWFNEIKKNFPDYIKYCGTVEFDKSTEVLKNYYALLFPTHFKTEGIPGTIIDAYASGVPVISAKWDSFDDIIDDNITGFGYSINNVDELINILLSLPSANLSDIKLSCLREAEKFNVDKVILNLCDKIG